MGRWRTLAESGLGLLIVAGLLLPALRAWTPVCVNGGSMRPALQPGDLAIIATGRAPQRGDIVLASVKGGRVLHRVSRVQPDGSFRLKGDANNISDLAPVPKNRIAGVVVRVVPVGAVLAKWKPA